MNTQIIIERVTADFFQECKEDYVGLWVLSRRLQEEGIAATQVKPSVMQIIKHALVARKIVAGEFIEKKFTVWSHSPAECIQRIDREWEKLGRNPNIGEIAWFTTNEMNEQTS